MKKLGTRVVYSMLGMMALWSASSAVANAQVTVTSVKVTVSSTTSTAVYCDVLLAPTCGPNAVPVWTIPAAGITVAPTKTLVLTQTGSIPVGGNFDTSDRAKITAPTLAACSTTDPCNVAIEINGIQVHNTAAGDPLNFYNHDAISPTTNEAHDWLLVATKPNYTLKLGYADNEHSATLPRNCATLLCFPTPFAGADTFLGAGIHGGEYDAGALLITGVLAPPTAVGRMTGGGSIFEKNGTRVTHGFEIHCDITDVPNRIEVNWPDGNNFHLDTLSSAKCTDDTNIDQKPPKSSPFDTFVGTGTGKLNGVAGATIAFTFVDAGEPGTSDSAAYLIKDKDGNVVLSVPATLLTKGNHQAHE